MNWNPSYPCWTWIVVVASLSMLASRAIAQSPAGSSVEFRIDTDVYLDTSRPPIESSQTLFLHDRIMDWDDNRRTLMRIDLRAQQIDLADFVNQRRCRIDIGEMATHLELLKSQQSQEQLQAFASAKEPQKTDEGYLLESGNLRYRFTAVEPLHPDIANAYAEFANLSAQVNAFHPPKRHPLLRLQLNEFLRQKSLLPLEIQRTYLHAKSNECVTARILVQNSLTSQDRERAKDWDVLVQTLRQVSDTEYFQARRTTR